jgi:hypothetical protein
VTPRRSRRKIDKRFNVKVDEIGIYQTYDKGFVKFAPPSPQILAIEGVIVPRGQKLILVELDAPVIFNSKVQIWDGTGTLERYRGKLDISLRIDQEDILLRDKNFYVIAHQVGVRGPLNPA